MAYGIELSGVRPGFYFTVGGEELQVVPGVESPMLVHSRTGEEVHDIKELSRGVGQAGLSQTTEIDAAA